MGAAAAGDTDEAVEVRPVGESDAPALRGLIERCYGDAYPKRVMYRPDELSQLISAGGFNGVVASAGEEIVGHIGFSWPDPEATVVEAGTTVVDPRWRGRGLMKGLAFGLAELVAADGASGFIHFPTTAHGVMQRASLSAGGRETGIMACYLPAETRDLTDAGSREGRLSVTVVYQPVVEAKPQEIFVPGRYRELVQGLAESLWLQRTIVESPADPTGESVLSQAFEESRGLERVTFERVGSDVAQRVRRVLEGTAAGLVHVDLPLSDPGVDFAVEQLLPERFAFAAWMPGWAGHDVLRLQWVRDPSEAELAPEFFSLEASKLMEMIRTELGGGR